MNSALFIVNDPVQDAGNLDEVNINFYSIIIRRIRGRIVGKIDDLFTNQ